MPFSNASIQEYAAKNAESVLVDLVSSRDGLSHDEARRRLEDYGKNHLTEKKKRHILVQFLSQFKNPLIIILFFATLTSAIFGEIVDASIIFGMIILSVALDFYLEYDAEKAAEKLNDKVKTKTIVIRNGTKLEIKREELCEGDLIFLNAGSMVPADARIISAKDFFVNQSALTGESFPAEKTHKAVASRSKDASISELTNIIFLGTNVVSGSATAIVIKTGTATEFGKIASQLSAGPIETDFDRGIKNFSQLVMKAIIFLVLFIFFVNSLLRHNFIESFLFGLAVAVGLTPELLPVIMSVNMAKGSMKMAKKGVIVKRLSSIPNFGSMDVLCTDKTGTLTEDKIHLVRYTDVFGAHSEHVLTYAYLNSFHQTGIKNTLDQAVLDYKNVNISGHTKIDEIPFDFVRKRMSVVVENKHSRFLVTKGAPESIFSSATHYQHGTDDEKARLTDEMREKVKEQYHEFSKQGYRVLAVAIKKVGHEKTYSKHDEKDMTLIGFIAFLDPPKHDAKEIIRDLERIGVDVKIITGDNELVTKKICDDIGIEIKGILLGSEIDSLTDDALKVRAKNTTIFARFSPDEKNRVINALKNSGHVVGYMGDGINDAPSLKNADIGISVESAVDVAKESADIVLTRKSLHVLKDGIEEGRKTFANTMKYILMNLSSNFGNMFSVAGAVIFLPFLPMLPMQILLNNFIYDMSQVTIPTDNVDPDMIHKPKRWNINFIKRFMLTFGPISSFFDFMSFFVLYWVFQLSPAGFQTGWFIESLATQTLVIHIIRTKKTPFFKSKASGLLLISTIACVAFGWILPYTPLGKFFGFTPLPPIVLAAIAGIVLVYLVCVETAKHFFYAKNEL